MYPLVKNVLWTEGLEAPHGTLAFIEAGVFTRPVYRDPCLGQAGH
jgi:hypothetical protein